MSPSVEEIEKKVQAHHQSGLGLSATLIALSVLQLRWAMSHQDAGILVTGLPAMTIVLAVLVQACHYFGSRHAAAWIFAGERRDEVSRKGKGAYRWSDRMVKLSLLSFVGGMIAAATFWLTMAE